MPKILITGCDMTRTMQHANITVDVRFELSYWKEHRIAAQRRMKELEEKLGEVIKEYFPDYGSDIVSNHEYNCKMYNL